MRPFLLYIWLFVFSFYCSSSYGQVDLSDSTALVGFFNQLNDQGQINLDWNFADPVSVWEGVELDSAGVYVIGLFLNGRQIEGPLPGEIDSLDFLLELDCSNNAITSLPDLSSFQLEILDCGNNLLRDLPELSYTLHELYCDSNQLTQLPALPEGPQLLFLGPANVADGLKILDCRSNLIRTLPLLPFTLEYIDAGDNRLRELPALPTDFLHTLYVDRNRLRNLPDSMELSPLDTFNCSWNELTFEDFSRSFGIGLIDRTNYAPQKGLGHYEHYLYPGLDIELELYPDTMPLPTNLYTWFKDDSPEVMSDTWLLTGIDATAAGNYRLEAENPNYPDLMLEGTIRMIITSQDSIPIDTLGPMVQLPEGATEADNDALVMIMDSLGLPLRRECWCDNTGIARLKLFGGDPSENTLVKANKVVPGSKSILDIDTTELDFLLILDPTVGPVSTLNCADTIQNADNAAYDALVALIDSGADTLHPDLNSWLWSNPSPNMDDNCFAEDYRGWDFPNGSPYIIDESDHGTHSMGIIRFNYPEDVTLNVMNLKVFEETTGVLFDLICAIHYAVDIGVDVINVSLGYFAPAPSGILYNALKRAKDAGIIVVISSGNDGWDVSNLPGDSNRWPGNFKFLTFGDSTDLLDNLIVVGALNGARNDTASFSNHGPFVDILAPGTGIRSTLPSEIPGQSQSRYGNLSGTSMSASFITRFISIVKAKAPDKTYQEIFECIRTSATLIPSSNLVGWGGKLNERATLECLGLEDAIEPSENVRPEPIRVYPNPFREVVNIILEDGTRVFENVTLRVTTMYGEVVYSETCNASTLQWNGRYRSGNRVPRGIYFLEVRVGSSRAYRILVLRL